MYFIPLGSSTEEAGQKREILPARGLAGWGWGYACEESEAEAADDGEHTGRAAKGVGEMASGAELCRCLWRMMPA